MVSPSPNVRKSSSEADVSAPARLHSASDLHQVLEVLLPGRSAAMGALRAEVRSACEDITARGILITGPAGSGKSTLARALALGRWLHLVKPEHLSDIL